MFFTVNAILKNKMKNKGELKSKKKISTLNCNNELNITFRFAVCYKIFHTEITYKERKKYLQKNE